MNKKIKAKFSKMAKRFSLRYLFVNHFAVTASVFIFVAFIVLFLLGSVFRVISIFSGDAPGEQNRMYFLSSIAQSLAAVLALVVTMTLVFVQLASQQFTPQVIRQKLRDPFFWTLIGLYIFAVLLALWLMSARSWIKDDAALDRLFTDFCVLLAGAAFLFLVPYTFATINGLKPEVFVRNLLKRGETEALDEVLHKTINEGLHTWTEGACHLINTDTIEKMKRTHDKTLRLEIVKKRAECLVNAGKRALREDEQEIFYAILRHLTSLTKNSTELVFRDEADVFNKAVRDLYEYAQEQDER